MVLEDYNRVIHRCFRCGHCKSAKSYRGYNCPAYHRFRMETYSPGGRLWLIRAMMNGEIKETPSLANLLYTCTMCGNCIENCGFEFSKDIIDIMVAARAHLLQKPVLPVVVKDYLKNIYLYGNPWKKPGKERGSWISGTGIHTYERDDEYLYYVGDIGSHVPVGRKMAGTLGEVLSKIGVSFGILGEDEYCDGNDVLRMGEEGLFEYLSGKNIQTFTDKGVQKVFTLSPHAYNVMKNDYPKRGGYFEVMHYTRLLRNRISALKQKMIHRLDMKVAYHDPCFLGRWNTEYDAPREVLQAIPGVELLEIDRNRENAFCCGGGGGNCFTDLIGSGGEDSPSRIRLRESYATGADVLAVACPGCLLMFEDALDSEGLRGNFKVMDISEIIAKTL